MRIVQADIDCLAAKPSQYPKESLPEIAFAGRSNVGKSSLLNLLTNRKNLARVSGSPGKTRTINFFDVRAKEDDIDIKFRIVDLPGYGYAKLSKNVTSGWGEMMETFLSTRKDLRLVVQLVDSRHGPTGQDVQMYEYLKHYGLSGVVVMTKSDKCKRSELAKNMENVRSELELTDEDIIIPISALKRTGHDKLLDALYEVIK